MTHTPRTWDRRAFACIVVAAVIGAAWAWFNLSRAGGNGFSAATGPLVWTVFATPFCTFWGWVLARRQEVWPALFVCFCIYFFGILIGARVERLALGAEAARASGHALYFQLTPAIQLGAGLLVALQRSVKRGTMPVSTQG